MARKDLRQETPLSPQTAQRYWTISLIVGAVVIGAVAKLLHMLTTTAEQIQAGVHQIWLSGKRIAANTVHIPLLIRTNQVAGQILEAADGIAGAAERIGQAVGVPAKK